MHLGSSISGGSGPLLTIAIPTRNRADLLAELLTSALEQVKNQSTIELLVSDNASSDHTADIVSQFIGRGLPIVYIRNADNIGSDANFVQCFERASGRFVWLIGDDDILYSDSISIVLDVLRRHDPDLTFIRPLEFRGATPQGPTPRDQYGRLPRVVLNPELFAWLVGNMFTLISCNIINKGRFKSIQHQPLDGLVGTGLVQLGWTLPLLTDLQRAVYVYDNCVAVRGGNRGGYEICRVFGHNYKEATTSLLREQPRVGRTLQTELILSCLPFLILQSRSGEFGAFENESFHQQLKPIYGNRLWYWIAPYPVARLPVRIATAWFAMIRFCRRCETFLMQWRS